MRADKSKTYIELTLLIIIKFWKIKLLILTKLTIKDIISQINEDVLKFVNKLHIEDKFGKI